MSLLTKHVQMLNNTLVLCYLPLSLLLVILIVITVPFPSTYLQLNLNEHLSYNIIYEKQRSVKLAVVSNITTKSKPLIY